MKLKEFIENLNDFVKEYPESLDLEVITSKDDEGNGYNAVHYKPSKGVFDDGCFDDQDNENINAICIN